MRYLKLVVISHTPHYVDGDGFVRGWGPTVRELDAISNLWSEVVHVGVLHPGMPSPTDLPYTSANIRFVPIPPSGGTTWIKKLSVLWKIWEILHVVNRELKGASHIQLRVPMGFGLYLIPWFALQFRRKYLLWIKYANNWVTTSAPLGYRLQRWMLKQDWPRCTVTINGNWPGQPSHCLSFENPCLTDVELKQGASALQERAFDAPFDLVFLGQLDIPKGVPELREALAAIPGEKVSHVHIVGEGQMKAVLEELQKQVSFKLVFHGWLSGEEVRNLFKKAHFLMLPSRSEGFPKVIAEACCYGCIPVCSDVGSIPQYVSEENGFLWRRQGSESFGAVLTRALNASSKNLAIKAGTGQELAARFTYSYYLNALQARVFGKNAQVH